MTEAPNPESLPESQLNELLRRADWRFLLGQSGELRVASLLQGRDSLAAELIGAGASAGAADVAVVGYPTRLALGAARDALRPGGEVVCLWRVPRPAATRRAEKRLRRAGFSQVRVFWPGPDPRHPPQFWLPLHSPAAIAHVLAGRPAGSPARAALRLVWRAAARTGMLAPLCAIGRLGDEAASDPADDIEAAFPPTGGQLLLTGGGRSINKAVGLSFANGSAAPDAVVKFSRVPAADEALAREASVLRALESDRPGVDGVPRLLAQGRRVGRQALAESAVHGRPLIAALAPGNFGELAGLVGEWLVGLADGRERAKPQSEWWQRLVGEPLDAFERNFGAAAGPETVAAVRRRLENLGDLPEACEHRDCSPWNVVLREDGAPGLLDWESAEPRGLPGLDLAYFLANTAFVLDGALESGRTRETYARLLDPTTSYGEVAAQRITQYCDRLGLNGEDFTRLRLLAWVIHSASDYSHLEMAAAGPPSHEALHAATFLGLVEAELGPF